MYTTNLQVTNKSFRLLLSICFLITAATVTLSCSGGSNPVSPDKPIDENNPDAFGTRSQAILTKKRISIEFSDFIKSLSPSNQEFIDLMSKSTYNNSLFLNSSLSDSKFIGLNQGRIPVY